MKNEQNPKEQRFHKIIDTHKEINRLLVHEKDIDLLLKKTCDILVNTRGYGFAWIGIFNRDGSLLHIESSGFAKGFIKLKYNLTKGDIPKLYQKVIDKNEFKPVTKSKNSCPLSIDYKLWTSFIAPIQVADELHGLINAIVPNEDAKHIKEQESFRNVADSIGFALNNIKEKQDIETMINTLPDAYFVYTDNMILSHINSAFCSLFQEEEDYLRGKNIIELLKKFNQEQNNNLSNVIHQLEADTDLLNHEFTYNNRFYTITTNSRSLSKSKIGIIHDITSLKSEQANLKQSEIKYRNLVNSLSDSVFILQDGIIKFVNPTLCRVSEYEERELIGSSFTKFIAKSEIEKVSRYYSIGESEKEANNKYQSIIVTKSQKLIPVEVTTVPVIFEDKTANQVILKDISESQRIITQLRDSEEKFRFLSESAFEGVVMHDQGTILEVNKALEKMVGYSKQELIGKKIFNFLAPHNLEITKKNILLPQAPPYVVQIKTKEGNYIFVQVESKEIPYQDKTIRIAGLRDITEQKKLESRNTMLSKAVQASPASIVITDKDGNIQYVNPFFEEKTGYSFREIIGKNPRFLKSGKHTSIFYGELWKTITSGQIWNGEFHNRKKNGELFWEQANISPIVDEKGRIIQFVAIKEDITEKKKTLKDLKEAKEKAEESDKLKSAFLANMSHEIRTPMNGIIGFTELLKEPSLSGDRQLEFIEIIQKSGERMLNTINDIIDISKIESGIEKVKMHQFDVSASMTELKLLFESEAKQKGIDLIYTNEGLASPVNFYSDAEKLNSILTNLIKNAIKFTSRGSISLGFVIKDKTIEFFVRDTGIGIPKHRQKAIFERFVQADITDSRVFEGSGLGLSISKSYAEMLGGELSLVSTENKGTTFYVSLPFLTEDTKPMNVNFSLDEEIKALPSGLKTLVVEDDLVSIELLKLILKNIAEEILVATNGQEAIDIARKNHDIDLILMDIKLPVLDGFKATEEIRKFNTKVRIVAQTAFAQVADNTQALKVGCNDFIPKPINRKALYRIIQNLFH